ncbi:MAG: polysaccharide deacetylase [Labilithrix sp.]|nr:polysaccharide deacetylase [Labilithrix sp.]
MKGTMRAIRWAQAIVAVAALGGCLPDPPERPTYVFCSGAQALTDDGQDGATLPARTLVLTFDQGPAERTWELSDYLHGEGIAATFFVNGKNVDGREWALAQLVKDGHLVGNLTETNAALPELGDAEIIDAVAQADARILPYVPGGRFFLRAPYAAWTPHVRDALDRSTMKKYLGPVGWDIGNGLTDKSAADFECWSDDHQLDVETCGDLYLAEITAKKKGIVLMHDGPLDPNEGNNEKTVDMVKYLVPKLKAAGFTFARVDQIPAPKPPPPDTSEPAKEELPSAQPAGPKAAPAPCGHGAG